MPNTHPTPTSFSQTLLVKGLDCPDCAATLAKAVQGLPQISAAHLDYTRARLEISSDDLALALPATQKLAQQMGYELTAEVQPEQSVTLAVIGLDCPDCAASLEKALQGLPQVSAASLDYARATITLVSHDLPAAIAAAQRLAEQMGHEILNDAAAPAQNAAKPWNTWLRTHRRDAATGLGALLLIGALLARVLGASQSLVNGLYLASMLASGIYVARSGWFGLTKAHTLDMNLLMSIAAIGAALVGEHLEGALTLLLFSVGEWLESYSTDRARNAIRSLMALAPDTATRLVGERQETVPVGALALGEQILVRPGERVPMDGSIVEGASALDQSPITGESLPVERGVGDTVYAGAINGAGPLTVSVTRLAENSTIARILHMVEEAQSSRAPAQRFVDRFAAIYTPIVIGLAALVAVVPPLLGLGAFDVWVYRALVLLVISCPCALVIATPVTLVSTLASAARSGVLIKGGRHIEALAKVRTIAFDKTGTLTQGKPQVIEAVCEQDFGAQPRGDDQRCTVCQDLLAKAAAVELRSEHALGQAVVSYAQEQGVLGRFGSAEGVTATAGMGILGQVDGHKVAIGNHAFSHLNGEQHDDAFCERIAQAEGKGQTVLVLQDACCTRRGYLVVADQLRSGAAQMVTALRRQGIAQVAMLTGDNLAVAERIAKQAGVDVVKANLMPEDKLAAIEALERDYGPTAMVGDGVNDAPALARATVGIAMGAAGTDTAIETADVALMGDDLNKLPFAIKLARRSMFTLRANIVVALAIKALFMSLAVAGYATLWMAVIADVGSSMLVTLNGMRLLTVRDSQ